MQEVSLEELFAQAEEIAAKLEQPQIALEDAFAAYEQGMQIIRACNGRIDQVEKKMLVMNEDGSLAPFDDAVQTPESEPDNSDRRHEEQ